MALPSCATPPDYSWQAIMGESPRKYPFEKGAKYCVRQSFGSLDKFSKGEVLVYEGSAYSPYDGMSGFDFRDSDGDLRRWDMHDTEPLDLIQERFEKII